MYIYTYIYIYIIFRKHGVYQNLSLATIIHLDDSSTQIRKLGLGNQVFTWLPPKLGAQDWNHVVLVGLARNFFSHFTIFHQATITRKKIACHKHLDTNTKENVIPAVVRTHQFEGKKIPTNIVTYSTGQLPTDSSTSPHHLLGTLAKRPISCASECLRATLLAPNINSCWPVRSRPPRQGKIAEIFGDFLQRQVASAWNR